MADNNKFKNSIDALIGGLEGYLSTKTVVGEPMTVGNTTIIPLADVSFGMGAGAYENNEKSNGGGGLGAKITPAAMLVINDDNARLISVKDNPGLFEKILDMVPGIISKFKNNDSKEDKEESPEDIFE